MKILELTNFSAGICGVWQRVRQESELLSKKGHKVMIFSSNATKGSNETAIKEDKIEQIKIKRFPFKKLGGESFMKWNFEKEAMDFRPEVIIAHGYRQLHTTKALKIARKIKSKVFLVTHAPFIEGDFTRTFFAKLAVIFYDRFIGPRRINKFDKIIVVTKWELPYIKKLGVKDEKIVYIPNGIPKEFFNYKKSKEEEKILFFGRISPIKNLEVLIEALYLIDNKKIILEIVGLAEEEYFERLKNLINEKKLEKRIFFSGPIYDLNEKIKKIDSAKIFVLPSKREGMPQALIEAMSRGKVVVASKNPGAGDLIEDGKNGYLFKNGNSKDLANKINYIFKNDKLINDQIKKNAKKSVEKFSWNKIILDLEKLF